MIIGDFDSEKRVFVIAEIGNNHEGDFDLALKMIDLAVDAGVSAVKFQTIVPDRLISSSDPNRIAQLEKFRFSYNEFEKLAKHARLKNVMFLSTPFDVETAAFLNNLVPAFKIASSDNNYFPLLKAVAQTGKPIIMSTGIADDVEIEMAVLFIENNWAENGNKSDLALLHCVSNYPVTVHNANLSNITKLKRLFDQHTVGYSDHCLGIEPVTLAVAMGARIIEKHFTIDKQHSDFRDHQLSADPKEMKDLVNKIRETEELIGSNNTESTEEDHKMKLAVRRSIAASLDLEIGHRLKEEDLTGLRPGTGIGIADMDKCIGRVLVKDVAKGELIGLSDLQ